MENWEEQRAPRASKKSSIDWEKDRSGERKEKTSTKGGPLRERGEQHQKGSRRT